MSKIHFRVSSSIKVYVYVHLCNQNLDQDLEPMSIPGGSPSFHYLSVALWATIILPSISIN